MTTRVTIEDGKLKGYYTAREFAEKCGVTEICVRQWVRRNKFWVLRIGDSFYIPHGTEKPGRKKRGEPVEKPEPVFVFDNELKHYYRIVISLKGVPDCPKLEIAAFMYCRIAVNYIDNILRKNADWDDETIAVKMIKTALPPASSGDETISDKIRLLKAYGEMTKKGI